MLAYCNKHGIPVDAKPKSNYSIDENLFHTSYESGVLEDAAATYEESMFKMTVSPQAAPAESIFVDVEFEKGVPVKLTNKSDGTIKVRIFGMPLSADHHFIFSSHLFCLPFFPPLHIIVRFSFLMTITQTNK